MIQPKGNSENYKPSRLRNVSYSDTISKKIVRIKESHEENTRIFKNYKICRNCGLIKFSYVLFDFQLNDCCETKSNFYMNRFKKQLNFLFIDESIVTFLSNLEKEMTDPNSHGMQILQIAIRHGIKRVIDILLKDGSIVDMSNLENFLYVIEEAKKFPYYKNTLKVLLKIKDSQGNTLLHHMAKLDKSADMDFLISIGADKKAVNRNGQTAIELRSWAGWLSYCLAKLEAYIVRASGADNKHYDPLLLAYPGDIRTSANVVNIVSKNP